MAIPTRVLVLGMAHEDGTIVNDELLPVAAACGLTPDQVRSCLRRLVAEGLFVRRGTGRNTTFAATAHGLAALGTTVERTRLAYVQDAAGRGWDRQWRLVAFAVPEKERAARDAFRDHLIELGGAAIQGGLYVSPHPWHKDAAAEAERLGIADAVTYATTDDLDIEGYVADHDIVVNPLLSQGYASIGCWPCTRAVKPGEDPRAGRWTGFSKTECGLHD